MKRLVICCDGTWNTPASGIPTNVVHIARAIQPQAFDGAQQIVFYQRAGDGTLPDSFQDGRLGAAIDRHIQDAYRFLVHNYNPGDELWFFGFSRGAYTARSLIGLLRNAWLLKKEHAGRIPEAYHIYRTIWGPDASNAVNFRQPYCQKTGFHFLGVWDTVGYPGIQRQPFSVARGHRHGFHDTCLSEQVENAYHALAIDERRQSCAPILWQTRPGRNRTEQCWFSGVHGDIGGGYPEAGLANIALRWIAGKAAASGLDLNQNYLNQVYTEHNREILHNSYRGASKAMGSKRRAIGVTNRDETLHPSAEQRYLRNGQYRPANLKIYLQRDEQIRLPL